MIKIAYIIDTIETPAAGTERQLLMLINNLDRDKFKPYLICLRSSEWLKQYKPDFEIAVLNVPSLFCIKFLKGLFAFKRMHRQEKFDIVQTFFKESNIFGTLAARLAGIKNIISSRRNIGYWLTASQKIVLRILQNITPAYLCNSESARQMTIEIEKAPREKTHIIYNGLELDKFKNINVDVRIEQRNIWGIKPDELLIGAVANLRPVKNIEQLIQSAFEIKKVFPQTKFVVIGEGSLRNELQERINQLNLADSFSLVGKIDDITIPLASFDIAVIPSQSESFSNSLIEYMAAGLPIVASDVGGNSEAIEHGKTGLLFSLNESDGLIKALTKLIENKDLSRSMSEHARKTAFSKYSKKQMVLNHENYYQSLIS